MKVVVFKLVTTNGPPYKLSVWAHQVVCVEDLNDKQCYITLKTGARFKIMNSADEARRKLLPDPDWVFVSLIAGCGLVGIGSLTLAGYPAVILAAGVVLLSLFHTRHDL